MGLLDFLFGGAPKKALLVDADEAIKPLFDSYLEKERVSLEQVKSCLEAKRRLGDYDDSPALFLVGVHLPDGNGVELMQALSHNRQVSRTPILFLAERINESEEQTLRRLFPSARVMMKPVQRKAFCEVVHDLLVSSQKKRPVAKASIRGRMPPPSRQKVRDE